MRQRKKPENVHVTKLTAHIKISAHTLWRSPHTSQLNMNSPWHGVEAQCRLSVRSKTGTVSHNARPSASLHYWPNEANQMRAETNLWSNRKQMWGKPLNAKLLSRKSIFNGISVASHMMTRLAFLWNKDHLMRTNLWQDKTVFQKPKRNAQNTKWCWEWGFRMFIPSLFVENRFC